MTRLSDMIAPGELLRGWTASEVPEEFARPHKGSRKPDCLTRDLLRVMREMEDRGLECIGSWTDAGQWQVVPDEPIVRCKDCRHAYEHADARGRWLLCDLSTYFEVKPDGFCAWGETKEDER